MKVSGTETPNHSASSATSVENGIAADEPLPHSTRFIMKNSENTTLEMEIYYNVIHIMIS